MVKTKFLNIGAINWTPRHFYNNSSGDQFQLCLNALRNQKQLSVLSLEIVQLVLKIYSL